MRYRVKEISLCGDISFTHTPKICFDGEYLLNKNFGGGVFEISNNSHQLFDNWQYLLLCRGCLINKIDCI